MWFDVISNFASKIGSWFVRWSVKKEEIRTRHFTKIKDEVLKPFLSMLKSTANMEERAHISYNDILTNKIYDNINSELFKDTINNHFNEIRTYKKQLEKQDALFNKAVQKITSKLSIKFKTEFPENSMRAFLILGETYLTWKLDMNSYGIMYGYYRICNAKEDVLAKIQTELKAIYKSQSGKEIRLKHTKREKSRKDLIRCIERALASENLKGECDFIK